jgi:type IV pilus assembly protein PilF
MKIFLYALLLPALLLFDPYPLYAQEVIAFRSAQSQHDEAGIPGFPRPRDNLTRARARTELGALYFQTGNWIVALEELTLAISADPTFAPAYGLRGLVLFQVNENESAEQDFRRALRLNENDPEINNNFGWFLCQTGRAAESLRYFQRAIRNPMYRTPESALLNLGACYLRIGELDLAEENIRRGLRLAPGNPSGLFHLANIHYERGNYAAAQQQLIEVVRDNVPNAETLWLFWRVERRLNNRAAAESLLTQLRRKYPDSREYQEFLKGNFE